MKLSAGWKKQSEIEKEQKKFFFFYEKVGVNGFAHVKLYLRVGPTIDMFKKSIILSYDCENWALDFYCLFDYRSPKLGPRNEKYRNYISQSLVSFFDGSVES